MKIAILSDIHANLPALEATLKSVEQQDVDAVYCLGDLVGYNVWPNEVIDLIRKNEILTLVGNHDVKAVDVHKAESKSLDSYAYQIVGKEEVDYLSALPEHIHLECDVINKRVSVLMVHGSPYSNREYLFEDKNEKDYVAMFLDCGVDVIICGHSHKPYHRIMEIPNNPGTYLHAINAGSVGKPKDGNPKSCYTVIEIDKTLDFSKKEAIQVDFIRVSYDIEKAARAIEESVLPDSLATMLREGY